MLATLLLLGSVGAGGMTPPAECAALAGRAASNVWERAKTPELVQYCDLLAGAAAKLASPGHIPVDVVELAEEAERTLPGRAAPSVLLGRALARLGKYDAALEAFGQARTKDPQALEEPVTLLVWARVLAYTGHAGEALAAYRVLMPRVSSLTLADRGVAYVGAGMLAMSFGASGIDEAKAILREARKNSQDAVQRLAALALALALDRSGEKAEARVVLAERAHENAPALLSEPTAIEALGPAADVERTALMALALEEVDPVSARSAWGAYLEGPGGKGPWAEHARKRAGQARSSQGRPR
jgi:tetratricopeptide (TPR) repeat protein